MPHPTTWLAVLALLPAASLAAQGSPAAAKKIRVAVMEIRPLGTEQVKTELLSEVALTEAASFDKLEIIGRSDIASMIGFEQQKKVLGCADDSSCLAEIGGALGVEYILIGSLGRLGALYRVDLKLVDTKKARVLARFGESVEGSEEKLVATVQRGTRQLLAPIQGGGLAVPLPPPPVAKAPAAPPPVSATKAEGGWTRQTWGWAAVGTGAALATVGVVFGLQAKKAYDDEKSATTVPDYESAKSKAKSSAMAADVCYVAGAVTAGVGVYLIFTGKPAVAVVPTRGGATVQLAGRF